MPLAVSIILYLTVRFRAHFHAGDAEERKSQPPVPPMLKMHNKRQAEPNTNGPGRANMAQTITHTHANATKMLIDFYFI